jgi:hypothetical protein
MEIPLRGPQVSGGFVQVEASAQPTDDTTRRAIEALGY